VRVTALPSLRHYRFAHAASPAPADPVVAEDGHTYERSAITHWLVSHDTSPLTREIIGRRLVANRVVQKNVRDLVTSGHLPASDCAAWHLSTAKNLTVLGEWKRASEEFQCASSLGSAAAPALKTVAAAANSLAAAAAACDDAEWAGQVCASFVTQKPRAMERTIGAFIDLPVGTRVRVLGDVTTVTARCEATDIGYNSDMDPYIGAVGLVVSHETFPGEVKAYKVLFDEPTLLPSFDDEDYDELDNCWLFPTNCCIRVDG